MGFVLRWVDSSRTEFLAIQQAAAKGVAARASGQKSKSSKQEGLFKQVVKTLELLGANPRHAGLHTHEFDSIEHPFEKQGKVFEAYVQNRTPGAYRLFWCYGPGKNEVTILAITPHP